MLQKKILKLLLGLSKCQPGISPTVDIKEKFSPLHIPPQPSPALVPSQFHFNLYNNNSAVVEFKLLEKYSRSEKINIIFLYTIEKVMKSAVTRLTNRGQDYRGHGVQRLEYKPPPLNNSTPLHKPKEIHLLALNRIGTKI